MIEVEGYKAFRGKLRVTPTAEGYAPYELTGDFLYKPEHDCWYGCGKSVPAWICEVEENV